MRVRIPRPLPRPLLALEQHEHVHPAQLAILDTDEAQNLTLRGQLVLADHSVDFFIASDVSDAFMTRHANQAGPLALSTADASQPAAIDAGA